MAKKGKKIIDLMTALGRSLQEAAAEAKLTLVKPKKRDGGGGDDWGGGGGEQGGV